MKKRLLPAGKTRVRLACSGGLNLEVSPNGSKRWFWKYRKDGKEGRMALGSYPDVGPKDARKTRDAAKAQKSEGQDPVGQRTALHYTGIFLGSRFCTCPRENHEQIPPP